MSGNQALDINNGIGGTPDLAITNHGSDWYWTVCAIMGVSSFAFIGMSLGKPREARLFHYITALITLVASIAYYSMASGLGQTPVQVEFSRPGSSQVGAAGTREIFWVRYVDWFVTTPLLLLDLLLTAGLPWPTILTTLVADEIMIVTGLVGALTPTSYKWGYWVFGTVALIFVAYQLAIVGRRSAAILGPNPSRTFNSCGVLTLFIWFLYPIAWGLGEGGNVIHPDSEAIFYGILDVIAKPVFGFLLLFGHRNIELAELGLAIRSIPGEKSATHGHHTGAHDGVHNGTTANTTV